MHHLCEQSLGGQVRFRHQVLCRLFMDGRFAESALQQFSRSDRHLLYVFNHRRIGLLHVKIFPSQVCNHDASLKPAQRSRGFVTIQTQQMFETAPLVNYNEGHVQTVVRQKLRIAAQRTAI